MPPECKQDEVENNKKEKRRTRRNPVLLQRTRSINNTKAIDNVNKKQSFTKGWAFLYCIDGKC